MFAFLDSRAVSGAAISAKPRTKRRKLRKALYFLGDPSPSVEPRTQQELKFCSGQVRCLFRTQRDHLLWFPCKQTDFFLFSWRPAFGELVLALLRPRNCFITDEEHTTIPSGWLKHIVHLTPRSTVFIAISKVAGIFESITLNSYSAYVVQSESWRRHQLVASKKRRFPWSHLMVGTPRGSEWNHSF